MKIYTQYDPPPADSVEDWGPSLARQEFKEESDINNIVGQYEKHGILPEVRNAMPVYADFTDEAFRDFQRAQNIVVGARELFEALPAKTRERFNNDPAALFEFVQDPENLPEAFKLGLLREDWKPATAPPATPPAGEPTK